MELLIIFKLLLITSLCLRVTPRHRYLRKFESFTFALGIFEQCGDRPCVLRKKKP